MEPPVEPSEEQPPVEPPEEPSVDSETESESKLELSNSDNESSDNVSDTRTANFDYKNTNTCQIYFSTDLLDVTAFAPEECQIDPIVSEQ